MLSKNKIKSIRALGLKKHRQESGLFVAEGPKVVGDLLERQAAVTIVATAEWVERWKASPTPSEGGELGGGEPDIIEVTEEELQKVSFLQHPQEVLAVFRLPNQSRYEVRGTRYENTLVSEENANDESNLVPRTSYLAPRKDASLISKKLFLALDGIQDPGNLGTIIRIADWFGIDTIFCSPDTADAYNPKTVQATMGSIARVNIVYRDLRQLIGSLPEGYPVYGTLLDGQDIYGQELTPHGLIVMGNEGNGISEDIRRLVNRRLLIPSYSTGSSHAESLNVAIATAITCAEFRRRG